jgi:hypothetical protein
MTQRPLQKISAGQGMVEYALILVGVVLIVILALTTTGTSVEQVYCRALSSLGGEGCGGCSYAFNNISEFSSWDGPRKDNDISINNNKACFEGHNNGYHHYLDPCAENMGGDDFVVNVKGATSVSYPGKNNAGVDILFRSQDENNGYLFTYVGWVNQVRFWKKVEGRWILMKAVRVPPGWDGQENDFQLEVKGDTFTAYKDGSPIAQAVDDTYTEGSAGIRTRKSAVTCIESMQITSLN